MTNQTNARNEVAAMETQYNEVLAWEAQFAQEIQELKNTDTSKKVTYKQKSEGARYVVTVVGYKHTQKIYRIWDREEQTHIGATYTNKRKAQNEIDDMIGGE